MLAAKNDRQLRDSKTGSLDGKQGLKPPHHPLGFFHSSENANL
jgi:hypothetical protein